MHIKLREFKFWMASEIKMEENHITKWLGFSLPRDTKNQYKALLNIYINKFYSMCC